MSDRQLTRIIIDAANPYLRLFERACPGPVDRPHRACINFTKTFDSRAGRWIYRFEKSFWSRWAHARRCIADLRWNGKVSCSPDETYELNAWLGLQTFVAEWLDANPRPAVLRRTAHGRWYEPWGPSSIARRMLFYAGVERPLPPARRYVYSNIVSAKRVGLSEVLSKQARAGSSARDNTGPKRRPIARLGQQEEALCFELMATLLANVAQNPQQAFLSDLLVFVRNKIVEGHIWLIRWVAVEELNIRRPGWDTISEGTIGLYEAIEGFDPARGCRFQTFAKRPIKQRIQDYMRRMRRLGRHSSTDALTESGHEWMLGQYRRDPAHEPHLKIISYAWRKNPESFRIL